METELSVTHQIEDRIYIIRGKKVMLDKDLAALYDVKTKILNQAVKRNLQRFPQDFMFQLTWEETAQCLRSQIVTLKQGQHRKYLPNAFSEHGILMLSSVLNSERAIAVNIHIMRVFTRLRELMIQHKDLEQRINELEKKYDAQFRNIFEAIRRLLEPPPVKPKPPIGFYSAPPK